MGIVLPDGILGNSAAEYIRWWSLRHAWVLALISGGGIRASGTSLGCNRRHKGTGGPLIEQMQKRMTGPDALVPQPIQFRERQCPVVVLDIVFDIKNQTAVTAPIQHSPQPASDHLEVEIGTVDRPRYDDGSGLRCVESFSKYSIVHQHLHFSGSKLLNCAPPNPRISPAAYRTRLDTPELKHCSNGFSVIDRCSKNQGRPCWIDILNLRLVRFDYPSGASGVVRDTSLHGIGKPWQYLVENLPQFVFVETQFRAFNRAMFGSCEHLHALQLPNYVLCIVTAKRSRIEAIPPISAGEPFGLFFVTTPIRCGRKTQQTDFILTTAKREA